MSHEALVFHIIHGSFVDGYGIRSTVFLKGCPLSVFGAVIRKGNLFSQN